MIIMAPSCVMILITMIVLIWPMFIEHCFTTKFNVEFLDHRMNLFRNSSDTNNFGKYKPFYDFFFADSSSKTKIIDPNEIFKDLNITILEPNVNQ